MFGTPEIHSMRRFMSEEQLQDPTFKMIEYHTKNHPGLTDFSLFKALELLGEKLTPSTDTLVERIRRMSFVQRELTQIVVESYRRNRFYTGGLLFWMYNDCWPASGWSLVDYYGYPKGGYYGIKSASKPVIASVERDRTKGSILCWVCNERLEQSNGIGRLFVLSLDAEATDKAMWSSEFEFAVAPGSSAAAATFDDAELRSFLDNRHVLVTSSCCQESPRPFHTIRLPGLKKNGRSSCTLGIKAKKRKGSPRSSMVAESRYRVPYPVL